MCSGSAILDALIDDRRNIPRGMVRRQNVIGSPTVRVGTPALRRCAVAANP
jgi:hypothetical protein